MSRLIIKNLPLKIKAEKLQELFSQYGTVTDVKLMFTKSGKFRKFAFVGFQFDNEADKAKEAFHNTLILNQKVVIETCKDFGVKEKVNSKHVLERTKNAAKQEYVSQDNKPESDSTYLSIKKKSGFIDDDSEDDADKSNSKDGSEEEINNAFSIQMRGCPFSVTEQQIIEFFYPVKPSNIQILIGKKNKPSGMVMVDFVSEKDQINALSRKGDYMGKRYIEMKKFVHFKKRSNQYKSNSKQNWMEKIVKGHKDCDVEDISDSGRLYLRNLSFACTEDDLTRLFEKFGQLSEVNMPIDSTSKKSVGYAFITFMFPEHAVIAFNELDGTVYQGRMLHILPAKNQVEKSETVDYDTKSSFKKTKASAEKNTSQSSHNWNSLFMGTNAVAEAISEKYAVDKNEVVESTHKHSAAVRMALGETHIVKETRDFLVENGISLDAFSQPNADRSKTIILVKNLPVGATSSELRDLFEKYAQLGRVVLAPAGVTAVIECLEPAEARNAFKKLAYRKYHHSPLYLEWAPVGTFKKEFSSIKQTKESNKKAAVKETSSSDEFTPNSTNIDIDSGFTLFVKNLNFETTEESLQEHFEKCGTLLLSKISKKKTHKSKALLSMGYGFVTYKNSSDGKNALRNLQHSMLDGHKLELKVSERKQQLKVQNRIKQKTKEQKTSKILVRNIPFQANAAEITSLFKSFGELKTVRLPKKLTATLGQTGDHRGFAFVDFVTKEDAKSAFNALCHSTHLYGRRLVLEWANTEDNSIDELRRKTSIQFHNNKPKKRRLTKLAVADAVVTAELDNNQSD